MHSLPKKTVCAIFLSILMLLGGAYSRPQKAHALFGVADTSFDPITATFSGISSASNSVTAGASTTTAINATTQTGIQLGEVAERVVEQIAKNIAKQALARMTEDTVNWINGGFDGKPLFLENPEAFYLNIRNQEIIGFANAIGYDKLNYPYAKGFLIGFIQAQKNTVNNWAQSSLNRALSNRGSTLAEFAADFNVGGWDGWLQLTQLPQNNPWGFQIEATEELHLKLAGTVQSKADEIRQQISDGTGFLSPTICVDPGPVDEKAKQNAEDQLNQMSLLIGPPTAADQAKIASLQKTIKDNTCKRKESTTPGTVVASQITTALGSQTRQTELGAALGSSLSAVFDALLNKFIDGGLTSLQTALSPENTPSSSWTYGGQQLGAVDPVTTGIASGWSSVSGQIVALPVFKKNVQQAIDNTSKELGLLQTGSLANPGIIDLLKNIPYKVQRMDQCLPGPNLGWEKRLKNEQNRVTQKIMAGASDDEKNFKTASGVVAELEYALDSFVNYIKDQMLSEIPSAPLILDQVENLSSNADSLRNYDTTRRKKLDTLSRLKSIQSRLSTIPSDPAPGSAAEKLMIEQQTRYNTLLASITSDEDLNRVRAELDGLKERAQDMMDLQDDCENERVAKGYSTFADVPDFSTTGGYSGTENLKVGNTNGTEKDLFCGWPIEGGFPHGTFKRQTPVSYKDLPLVNGNNVFDPGTFSSNISVDIDCDYIYPAMQIDYIKAGNF